MKYTSQIEINTSIEKAVALFENPDNYDKWMEGLVNFEPTKGKYGEPGSKAVFKFKSGGREMSMEETIVTHNLPEEHTVTYAAQGVYNRVTTRFERIAENQCRCITEHEFRFKGFMKLMGWLMPGAFKKQSMKYLQAFKGFVENES